MRLTVAGSASLQQLKKRPRALGQRLARPLAQAVGGLLLLATLWAGYWLTTQPLTLVIDGQPRQIRTHQQTVAAVLQEMGLTLQPEDRVQPPPQAPLSAGESIRIELARPVLVEVDGQSHSYLTHRQAIDQVLTELGLAVRPRDEIFINGQPATAQTSLPQTPPLASKTGLNRLLAATTPQGAVAAGRPQPVQIIIHRAMPLTLHDGPARSRFYTARLTVGEALLEQGLTVYLGDRVTPPLATPLTPGLRIYIERATPVTIQVDDRTLKTRTQGQTVGQVLAQEGVALMGQDYSQPPLEQAIAADETIEIIRVRETLEIEESFITFETEWVADDSLPLDRQEVRQQGNTGVIKSRTRVRYENGQETARQFEDEWLAETPSDRLIAYGTQIQVRTIETEQGPVEYWRRIPMLTTAYNAASAGKDSDHPRYGITRIGVEAGYGVVAVDPRVIPLRSRVYVPGYGVALAGDTGGAILGKHIDLGYDDGQPLPTIYEWRDVYLLTPIPSADNIRYVLPQWPQR